MDDSLHDLLIRFLVAAFVVFTFFMGLMAGSSAGYKQGQLDFQRGQVEWLLVGPDEVHHIQKEK